ncbi:MAG: hypothetical protein LRY51_08325 [Geovibrio sp.]|nr:hypothetical protein [Geovibrio sp.]
MLSGGLGNTSFVGFPMINAFYGEELIGIGVLCDQGSFFVLSTLGIMVAAKYASGRVSSWEIVQKVLMFPLSGYGAGTDTQACGFSPLVHRLPPCAGSNHNTAGSCLSWFSASLGGYKNRIRQA